MKNQHFKVNYLNPKTGEIGYIVTDQDNPAEQVSEMGFLSGNPVPVEFQDGEWVNHKDGEFIQGEVMAEINEEMNRLHIPQRIRTAQLAIFIAGDMASTGDQGQAAEFFKTANANQVCAFIIDWEKRHEENQ